MALSGSQGNLSANMLNDLVSKIEQSTGVKVEDTKTLGAICQAIAETVVAHIVANAAVLVNSGIPVSVTVNVPMDPVTGDFTRTGTGNYPITATGNTTSTGSGTVQ